MKFLCVMLTFAAGIAVSTALVCYSDEECELAKGSHCFCLRPKNAPEGECACTMDPKYINVCMVDGDCSWQEIHGYTGRTRCVCQREHYFLLNGECKCHKL